MENEERPDGTVDSNAILCNLCSKEFSYHRSTSSLKYHLNAKHLAQTSSEVRPSTTPDATVSNQSCQATLEQAFRLRQKSTCDRFTNSIAKWIAMVEDRGLKEALQI